LENISHTQTEKQLSPPTSERPLDNPDLFEGDIKLPETTPIDGVKPAALFDSKIWSTKKIPYEISPNYSMIGDLFHYSLFFFLSLIFYVSSPR